jgi:YHS domain-containing protein/thiol-disulfide isomerase/thioredoxin
MTLRVNWIWIGLVLFAGSAPAQDQIAWQTDIAKALKQAKAEKKLVLVHFYGDACPPCRTVEQKVFPQPAVVQAVTRNYVPVKINIDREEKIAAHYAIRRIPTDIFLSEAGQELHRDLTRQSAEEYVTLLDNYAIQTGIGGARQASLRERESRYDQRQYQASEEQPPQAQQQYVQNQYAAQDTPVGNRYAPQEAARTQSQRPEMYQPEGRTVHGGQQYNARPPQPQNGPYGSQLPQQPIQPAAAPAYAPPQRGNYGQPSQTTMQRANFQDSGDITARQPIRNHFVPVKDAPPLGMEGYCPVSVSPPAPGKQGIWKKGDPRFGAVHRGRTYLFASAREQAMFLADPDAYSPVLSGADPVIFAERGELVEGNRTLGIAVSAGGDRSEMYLFATVENLERFEKNPKQYAVTAHQAMLRSETQRKYR